MDAAITRCAITKASDWKKKQTEFGRKSWLNWAVYRQHGFYNPLLGEQTGITREDLARFWEALACMFRNSDAASKGEMTMHDIVVFVHKHPRGDAPSHLLFQTVKCEVCNNLHNQPAEQDAINSKKSTMIQREGFEKYYSITVTNPVFEPSRPLHDLWYPVCQ
jgi:Cas7 group CRISPR-associated protein Csh2